MCSSFNLSMSYPTAVLGDSPNHQENETQL